MGSQLHYRPCWPNPLLIRVLLFLVLLVFGGAAHHGEGAEGNQLPSASQTQAHQSANYTSCQRRGLDTALTHPFQVGCVTVEATPLEINLAYLPLRDGGERPEYGLVVLPLLTVEKSHSSLLPSLCSQGLGRHLLERGRSDRSGRVERCLAAPAVQTAKVTEGRARPTTPLPARALQASQRGLAPEQGQGQGWQGSAKQEFSGRQWERSPGRTSTATGDSHQFSRQVGAGSHCDSAGQRTDQGPRDTARCATEARQGESDTGAPQAHRGAEIGQFQEPHQSPTSSYHQAGHGTQGPTTVARRTDAADVKLGSIFGTTRQAAEEADRRQGSSTQGLPGERGGPRCHSARGSSRHCQATSGNGRRAWSRRDPGLRGLRRAHATARAQGDQFPTHLGSRACQLQGDHTAVLWDQTQTRRRESPGQHGRRDGGQDGTGGARGEPATHGSAAQHCPGVSAISSSAIHSACGDRQRSYIGGAPWRRPVTRLRRPTGRYSGTVLYPHSVKEENDFVSPTAAQLLGLQRAHEARCSSLSCTFFEFDPRINADSPFLRQFQDDLLERHLTCGMQGVADTAEGNALRRMDSLSGGLSSWENQVPLVAPATRVSLGTWTEQQQESECQSSCTKNAEEPFSCTVALNGSCVLPATLRAEPPPKKVRFCFSVDFWFPAEGQLSFSRATNFASDLDRDELRGSVHARSAPQTLLACAPSQSFFSQPEPFGPASEEGCSHLSAAQVRDDITLRAEHVGFRSPSHVFHHGPRAARHARPCLPQSFPRHVTRMTQDTANLRGNEPSAFTGACKAEHVGLRSPICNLASSFLDLASVSSESEAHMGAELVGFRLPVAIGHIHSTEDQCLESWHSHKGVPAEVCFRTAQGLVCHATPGTILPILQFFLPSVRPPEEPISFRGSVPDRQPAGHVGLRPPVSPVAPNSKAHCKRNRSPAFTFRLGASPFVPAGRRWCKNEQSPQPAFAPCVLLGAVSDGAVRDRFTSFDVLSQAVVLDRGADWDPPRCVQEAVHRTLIPNPSGRLLSTQVPDMPGPQVAVQSFGTLRTHRAIVLVCDACSPSHTVCEFPLGMSLRAFLFGFSVGRTHPWFSTFRSLQTYTCAVDRRPYSCAQTLPPEADIVQVFASLADLEEPEDVSDTLPMMGLPLSSPVAARPFVQGDTRPPVPPIPALGRCWGTSTLMSLVNTAEPVSLATQPSAEATLLPPFFNAARDTFVLFDEQFHMRILGLPSGASAHEVLEVAFAHAGLLQTPRGDRFLHHAVPGLPPVQVCVWGALEVGMVVLPFLTQDARRPVCTTRTAAASTPFEAALAVEDACGYGPFLHLGLQRRQLHLIVNERSPQPHQSWAFTGADFASFGAGPPLPVVGAGSAASRHSSRASMPLLSLPVLTSSAISDGDRTTEVIVHRPDNSPLHLQVPCMLGPGSCRRAC